MTDTPTIDDWLRARHNQWQTPAGLINEYVQKATGSAVARANRVVLGQDNEVYAVTTAGNHLIIDFVNWDAYYSDRVPTSKLVASYGNQNLFTDSYDILFHLVLLREAFIMLMVHAARENPHGVQGFITEMERALRYFAHAH